MKKLFLSVNDITIRVYDKFFFAHTSWQVKKGEQWLIIGPNGSGKSIFAKALAGLLPLKHGEIICHFVKDAVFSYPQTNKDKISYISFDTQQQVLARDSFQRDLASYVGLEKSGKTVREYLGTEYSAFSFKQIFQTDDLLDRDLTTLSTGEMRKVFIIKALLQKPKLLLLDEPFDGLDINAKQKLMQIINEIMKYVHVILIVHRPTEIPDKITHVLVMKNCKIFMEGTKKEIGVKYPTLHFDSQPENLPWQGEVGNGGGSKRKQQSQKLIEMKNVTVRYGDKTVLDNINWTVRKGENWVILGDNGAGKSTLIHIITGDHQQGYANNITMFGKKKETVSLWEIKEQIGIVSTDIMLRYHQEISTYDVILSGFFDSIGLYKKATDTQKKIAEVWIKKLHIQNLVNKDFQHLSFGQKRLILIARAVIKSPKLLIVDEPCHGLDQENREKVLKLLDVIGRTNQTNLLFITHNQDEISACITNILKLEKGRIVSNV